MSAALVLGAAPLCAHAQDASSDAGSDAASNEERSDGSSEVTLDEREQEREHEPPAWEGVWSLYGASVGLHTENGENGFSVGIELSDVHVSPMLFWYGYFADLRFSSLARGVDLTIGMEAGFAVIGVDLGLYARIGRESAIGFRGRGCFTGVVVSFCGGGGYTNRGGFVEVALLLKYGRRREPDDEDESDSNADAETRRDDEAPTRAIEFPMADERMFILEAPFQEGVDTTEPRSEPDDEAATEDGSVPSDGVAAESETTSDMLDAESRPRPEIVEPAEVDAVEKR